MPIRMSRSLGSLAFVMALMLPACMRAELVPGSPLVPHDAIVVVGQGEAYGKPDIANLQLGVEARAADPKAAIAAANEKMAQLIEALKTAGVKPEDMQTRDFNIHSEQIDPGHGYPEPMGYRGVAPDAPVAKEMMAPAVEAAPARAPKAAGATPAVAPPQTPPLPPPTPQRSGPVLVYRVSNMLHITIRQIESVGDVLSRAVEAGANQAWGVSFDIDDPEPLASKSRAEAIEDARKQANELARLAGVKLGRVVSVMDEEGGGVVAPAASRRFDKAELSRVPVEGGQMAVQRRVRVVFAIEPPTE